MFSVNNSCQPLLSNVDVCCLVDVENQLLCKYTLKEDDLTKLRDAIEDLYYFEFVIGKKNLSGVIV